MSKLPKISPTTLFSLTLFLSAGLMFAVQPMLGKMLLPMVGGAPSGWLTALAFFQIGLLGGYWVAHMLSRYPARAQGYATLGLLVLGAVMLPPHLTAGSDSNIGSALQVLTLLLTGISLPYVALSTVSSGLQRLYAAGEKTAGEKPYFLYAASNLGSFAGLLSYPFIVEPSLPLTAQSVVWACGYGLLIVLVGGLLLLPVKKEAAAEISAPAEPALPTPIKLKLKWLVLAFVPSSLSMGLTALITADLGSVPLFWVVPLALYLLTFVIAFGRNRKLQSEDLDISHLILTGMVILIFVAFGNCSVSSWTMAAPLVGVFFVTALWCHLQLASLAPDESRLTEFYLWLALGGALGGIFNAFLAPVLFMYPLEFVLILLMSVMLHPMPRKRWLVYSGTLGTLIFIVAGASTLSVDPEAGKAQYQLVEFFMRPMGLVVLAGIAMAALFPHLLAVTGIVLMALIVSPLNIRQPVDIQRDFFGVMKIVDSPWEGQVWRRFMHGSTIHGMQMIKPTVETSVVSYYAPLRNVFEVQKPRDVAVLGLGAGIILCLQAPDRHFTVYEIDPLVREMAMKWFTFIKECGEPRWRIGDGRLELQRDTEARYDMIIADAFSSDSIPVHLLTREALELYLRRLNSGGLLTLHISNRYYDLIGPISALAHDLNSQAWLFTDRRVDFKLGKLASQWVIIAPPGSDAGALQTYGWQPLTEHSFPIWRDDYANLLRTMRILQNVEKP
ncbi:MAG: fused MFS/spermidine synthase [Alphaproteobacteria bacterium]